MKTWAIFNNVFSNYPALYAVLNHAKSLGSEAFLCLGNLVGFGPQPLACLKTAHEEHILLTQGQMEFMVGAGKFTHSLADDQFTVKGALSNIKELQDSGQEQRLACHFQEEMYQLDKTKIIKINEKNDLVMGHSSLSPKHKIWPPPWPKIKDRKSLASEIILAKRSSENASLVLLGNTRDGLWMDMERRNIQNTRLFNGRVFIQEPTCLLVNPGSVGQLDSVTNLDENGFGQASYVTLHIPEEEDEEKSWVEFHTVRYNAMGCLQTMKEKGFDQDEMKFLFNL